MSDSTNSTENNKPLTPFEKKLREYITAIQQLQKERDELKQQHALQITSLQREIKNRESLSAFVPKLEEKNKRLETKLKSITKENIELKRKNRALELRLEVRLERDRHALLTQTTEEPCSVYVMTDNLGKYKIGISKNPDHRKQQLEGAIKNQALNGTKKLQIVYEKRSTKRIAQNTEKQLHAEFASLRLDGEWFEMSDNEVQQVIAKCDMLIK